MIDKIKEKALALAPVMEELFQTLHRCPELGREEHRTANLIRRRGRAGDSIYASGRYRHCGSHSGPVAW